MNRADQQAMKQKLTIGDHLGDLFYLSLFTLGVVSGAIIIFAMFVYLFV